MCQTSMEITHSQTVSAYFFTRKPELNSRKILTLLAALFSMLCQPRIQSMLRNDGVKKETEAKSGRERQSSGRVASLVKCPWATSGREDN